MCCNGVLFFSVRLQPEDPERKLSRLGLKIKRRKDGLHLLQPCTAHTGTSCKVYENRPARCRLFVCRQLIRVEAGEISEADAREAIEKALQLTARVTSLLEAAGDSRSHKSLAARHENALTPPFAAGSEEMRSELSGAMRELEAFLAAEFRTA